MNFLTSFIVTVLCCLSFNSYADNPKAFTWKNNTFYYDNNKYVMPANQNKKMKGIPVILCAKSITNPNAIPVAICCVSKQAAKKIKGHFELTPSQDNGCKPGEVISTQCDEQLVIPSMTISAGSLTYRQAMDYCKTIQ